MFDTPATPGASRPHPWALFVTLSVFGAVSGACTVEPPEPTADFRPTATVQDIMRAMIDPAADAVWDAVVTTVTTEVGLQQRLKWGGTGLCVDRDLWTDPQRQCRGTQTILQIIRPFYAQQNRTSNDAFHDSSNRSETCLTPVGITQVDVKNIFIPAQGAKSKTTLLSVTRTG